MLSPADLEKHLFMEEVKNIIFLAFGKHILHAEAEEIIQAYNNYLNKDHISIWRYAIEYYETKKKR
jgi:hypothetical protein